MIPGVLSLEKLCLQPKICAISWAKVYLDVVAVPVSTITYASVSFSVSEPEEPKMSMVSPLDP
jgi:hypothetical protein